MKSGIQLAAETLAVVSSKNSALMMPLTPAYSTLIVAVFASNCPIFISPIEAHRFKLVDYYT